MSQILDSMSPSQPTIVSCLHWQVMRQVRRQLASESSEKARYSQVSDILVVSLSRVLPRLGLSVLKRRRRRNATIPRERLPFSSNGAGA